MTKSEKRAYLFLLLFQAISLIIIAAYYWQISGFKAIVISIVIFLIINLVNYFLHKRLIGHAKHFICVSMLFSIGILEIYRLDPSYGLKQMVWFILGVILMYVTYLIIKNTVFYKKLYWVYVGAIYILFIYTLLFGVVRNGAKNWISIFNHLFQPAEFIKVLYILQLASMDYELKRIKHLKYYNLLISFSYLLFLIIQRDLGSAAIIFSILIAYLYAFEKNRIWYRGSLLLFGLFGTLGFLLFSHVRVRFEVWLHPFLNYSKKGYQIVTSLTAISNGGFFGKGIGLGIPNIIPVNISDMILASIMEEMGIIVGIMLIVIYLIFIIDGLNLSKLQNSLFHKKTSVLILSLFIIQFMIILMGTLNIIPLTGVTAPFISYGGSSMLSSFILLGVLQGSLRVVK